MKIAHIADVHVRLYKRHAEYREVFKKLYQSLREHRVDRIALLGDIFHSKSILSPEAVELAAEFFTELAKIAPVDIVVGNHDVNIRNNTRLDAISPIVELVNAKDEAIAKSFLYPITVYLKSGWHNLGTDPQVVYGVFSCLDEQNFPTILTSSPKDQTFIALFHGNLNGSYAENMYKFENTGHDADVMFKNYSIVLLGDIHKRQQIKPHMWYSGSLLQCDFGEEIEKGYLIWDTDTCEPIFVPIPNDYVFYNLKTNYKVTPQNLPEIQNCSAKPQIRLTLEKFDYTIAEIKAIEIELTQKYNPISIEVKRDVKIVPKKDVQLTKIKSTSDVNIQNDLIRNFLGNTVSSEAVKRVIEVNKYIRPLINNEDILVPSVWKIKEIEWSNTFSYGADNILNFDKIKGLTGIFAQNRSGKSNFIDTILYVLFNKSSRAPRITNIINNQMDNCKAVITLEVNGELWRVSRKSSRNLNNSTATKVFLEKQQNGQWCQENGDSRTDTDKIIRRLIGSFDDLIVSSISPQGKIAYFLESGLEDTFRLELLSRFLGLNIFKIQYDLANKMNNESEILLKQYKQIDYATFMKSYQDEIDKLNDSLIDFEEDKIYQSSHLEQFSIQIATLKAMIQEIADNTKTSEYDKEKLERLIVQLRTQKQSEEQLLKDEIDRSDKLKNENLQIKLKETEAKFELWTDFNKDIQKIESDIRVAKMGLKKDRSQIDILSNQIWLDTTDICKTCEFYQNADKLRKELTTIEEEVTMLTSQKLLTEKAALPFINSEISLNKIKDQIKEFEQLENSVKFRKVTIDNQSLQIDKAQSIILEQNKELQKIESLKQIKESNAQVNALILEKETEKIEATKRLNYVEYCITAHSKRIAELEEKIQQLRDSLTKLSELERNISDYNLYLKCMHREGIPYTIMSNYIDIINQEIQKIVGDYITFGINFSLDNDKRSVAINLMYENGTVNPIELGSGMEKMIAAIAIRAALVSISNIPRCNLFVVDESFGQLDRENIATVDKLLDRLKTMFENVLLISHVPDIMDFVDQTITIDLSSGHSKISLS